VVQIEGRHHVFYVASQRIPADTEVRATTQPRPAPSRGRSVGAGGRVPTSPAGSPHPWGATSCTHKAQLHLLTSTHGTAWHRRVAGVHGLRAQLLGGAGGDPSRARADRPHRPRGGGGGARDSALRPLRPRKRSSGHHRRRRARACSVRRHVSARHHPGTCKDVSDHQRLSGRRLCPHARDLSWEQRRRRRRRHGSSPARGDRAGMCESSYRCSRSRHARLTACTDSRSVGLPRSLTTHRSSKYVEPPRGSWWRPTGAATRLGVWTRPPALHSPWRQPGV